MTNIGIDSKLYTLADILKESPTWHFNVPIYQRLYVWGEDQVRTLLNDVINAYERKDDIFFLGGTLLVEQNEKNGRYFELIDGQQRFTTLWLLCHAWSELLREGLNLNCSANASAFSEYQEVIDRCISFLTVKFDDLSIPRLRFAIRPEVNQFLESLVLSGHRLDVQNEEVNERMQSALVLMKSVFATRSLPRNTDHLAHLAGLINFLFENVQFVITRVPRETDLNKLFEIINNRGVQLQHHEILKARMLKALPLEDRGPYAVLWEACADMDNFIERSLSGLSGLLANEVTVLYEQNKLTDAKEIIDKVRAKMQERQDYHSTSLYDILELDNELSQTTGQNKESNSEPSWVRSILGFPLFLQHTLRIWLNQHEQDDLPRLLDRELLTLFQEHFFNTVIDQNNNGEHVKSFIELLWRLRVLFDQYFIKWVDQDEEEIHLISQINISTSEDKRYIHRLRNTDAHRGFALLQSMLYHSQEITTQYWITPLLNFIHQFPDKLIQQYFDYLCHLDNHLFGCATDVPLVVRTKAFMKDHWLKNELIFESELKRELGVRFAHYWFYKLEFVLWYQKVINKEGQKVNNMEGWQKFRITAKNSVEHISPQKPIDRDNNCVDKMLDCFGNLALVSRSLNSEYGNLPFNEKRQRFLNKNKSRVDSLKMDLIYRNNEEWNDDKALEHQEAMIDCMNRYYNIMPKGSINNA